MKAFRTLSPLDTNRTVSIPVGWWVRPAPGTDCACKVIDERMGEDMDAIELPEHSTTNALERGRNIAAAKRMVCGAQFRRRAGVTRQRSVVCVRSDDDSLQDFPTLWTLVRYAIRAASLVANNRCNANDDFRQLAMAKIRGGPGENRWMGRRIADPEIALVGVARDQGIDVECSIRDRTELEAALRCGLTAVGDDKPCLIGIYVAPQYGSTSLSRSRAKAQQRS